MVPQGFRGALADDDAGSHGVAGGHARHDRAVCNAKVFDPIDLKLTVYDRHRIAPHCRGTRLMVVSEAASRMKFSSAAPLRLPGMTSRFVKGRSAAELPISRQTSTHATAAFRSSGWDSVLASICRRSSGLGPVKRIWPRLFGRTTPPYIVQEAAGGLNLALVSALQNEASTWQVCKSGVSRPGLLFQKNVASPPLLRGARGC